MSVQVVPGAKKSKIVKIRPDGCVVVNLAHAASDDRCHPALLNFLSEVLSVEPENLEIIVGESSDYKIISIFGVDSTRVDELLRNQLRKRS